MVDLRPIPALLAAPSRGQRRGKAKSRRKPQPLNLKPVTVGDLIREGKPMATLATATRAAPIATPAAPAPAEKRNADAEARDRRTIGIGIAVAIAVWIAIAA